MLYFIRILYVCQVKDFFLLVYCIKSNSITIENQVVNIFYWFSLPFKYLFIFQIQSDTKIRGWIRNNSLLEISITIIAFQNIEIIIFDIY